MLNAYCTSGPSPTIRRVLATIALLLIAFSLASCGGGSSIVPVAHAQQPAPTGNEILTGHYVYKSEGWMLSQSGQWEPFFEEGVFDCNAGVCTLHGMMDSGTQILPSGSVWTVTLNGTSGTGTSTAGDQAHVDCNSSGSHCFFVNTATPPTGDQWQAIPWLAEFWRD